MKRLMLFVFAFSFFILTSCNDDPVYYYDSNPSANDVNESNDESSTQETNKDLNDESPTQETNNDTNESKEEAKDSSSQNEENKNNNEPGELNDDGWHGALF